MFKEYYKLYWTTFKGLWKSRLDATGYSIEIFSGIISGFLFIRANGWGAVVSNFGDFCLMTLAVPGGLAILYSIYKLAMTPVEIYKNKQTEIENGAKERELELEKYNWKKIEFRLEPYSIIGMQGWGLKIINNKQYDFSRLEVTFIQIRINHEVKPRKTKKIYFGFVDRSNGTIHEKVNFEGIMRPEYGKDLFYPITEVIVGSSIDPITYRFVTADRGDIEWAFESGLSSAITNSIGVRMALEATKKPQPIVLIEIQIKGIIKVGDEKSELPTKTKFLQVYNDGSLLFYDEEKG